MTLITNLKQLYEIDDQQWLSETINLLKQKRFNELDLENLIEELDDLGSEKKNAISSLLMQIIKHLLLLQYWTAEYENNVYHWRSEVVTFRDQIEGRLTKNLYNYLQQEINNIYTKALKQVKVKTNFKVDFPEECPYTLEQLLDENYL
ncbi:DUF29 domain-containing protein [Cuspidothrix issatschenkoi LEGE 03284]|uniref:DUF29 domain-containing protein n=1 Tax=Cuspidothrix issatschenkoi TaxID=230752 RepID=UPI0018813FE0|nr:DUF29 domain-containing protein [Cuspidothrix issatschenkoi]MBE9233874.1 DUF29 domain-containing protein [Cuspidothrix issatschenkoi LEGE 03284]